MKICFEISPLYKIYYVSLAYRHLRKRQLKLKETNVKYAFRKQDIENIFYSKTKILVFIIH